MYVSVSAMSGKSSQYPVPVGALMLKVSGPKVIVLHVTASRTRWIACLYAIRCAPWSPLLLYCSSQIVRSWLAEYVATWSQQKPPELGGTGNSEKGFRYAQVIPASRESAANQLPV